MAAGGSNLVPTGWMVTMKRGCWLNPECAFCAGLYRGTDLERKIVVASLVGLEQPDRYALNRVVAVIEHNTADTGVRRIGGSSTGCGIGCRKTGITGESCLNNII